MALLADRFVMRDDRTAIDLATGNRVEIVCGTAGGVADQARWAARCSSFMQVHYRGFAPLIDFGGIGEHQRFEAWRTDGPWRGDPCDAERVCEFGRAILRATTRTVGAIAAAHVRSLDGRPVLVPDQESGSLEPESSADSPPTLLPLAALGLHTLEHSAIEAIGNLLREASGSAVRTLALWGPRGAGLTHAARSVARHARLCGCVPVDAETMAAGAAPDLERRSICLLVRGDARLGWQRLVEHTLHHARPRLVLFITDRAVLGVRAIPLDRFAPDALIAAVRPQRAIDVHGSKIIAAARQAQGLAGRMAAALWPTDGGDQSRASLRVVRASEHSPDYGEARVSSRPLHDGCEADDMSSTQERFGGTSMRVISWPAAGDTAIHLERLERGLDDLAAGRLARGERSIRDAIGCLTRRQAWDAAWRGSLGLARALRERGRLSEAQRLVDAILPTPARTAAEETLLSALVLSGVLATDALLLDEGETLLSAAVRAARGLGTRELTIEASLALARCLFWRGRYEAAEHTLSSLDPNPSMAHAIRVATERSRLALGRHNLAAAMAHANEASDLAETHGEPRLRASAAYAKAMVHQSIGDYRSSTESGLQAVREGRRARAPLLVLRARLLLVETRRRQGHRGAAIRLVRRLGRMPRAALPAVLRARVDLVGALLADAQSDIGPRQAQAAGAPGLILFAAPAVPPAGGVMVSEAIDLLRLCQAAVDPDRVLVDTCRFVRETLQASAVGVFITTAGTNPASQPPPRVRRANEALGAKVEARLACAEGGRLDPALALRVCTADTSIAPHALRVVVESGAPIRYGGMSIGAVVARWGAGQTPDAARVLAVLETVAAAIGPAVAERRLAASASVPESSELIGVSRPASDLRDAIERAAPAPFAVMIEGESGCGKELVARALHRRSPRRDRPCVVINCASLPEELVESELFGHARGAFTGALGDRVGVFESAHQGTLFLDEIGELSLRAQAKVLRTIQEGEIRRVGDNGVRRVDVRIVAATNRKLRDEVEAGRFRADLLYRLDVVRIVVPPLRERRDDVVVLAEHFWREAASRVGSRATLGAATLAALARYDWPGNVRELQNVLAGLVVRSPRRGIVPPSALPAVFHSGEVSGSLRLDVARREFDANFVRAALARAGGCRVHAARDLGVTRQGLTKLIARLGVETGDRERAACD